MKRFLSACTIALGTFAFGTMASASIIDFTNAATYSIDTATTASGDQGGGWTAVAVGGPINISEAGPGTQGPLLGANDGLGIGERDDEISLMESFTITFNDAVTIVGLFFLDHFEPETALVSVDGGANVSFASIVPRPGIGFTSFATSLTGTSFTFTVDIPNEIGVADYALAGIDLAPIPLPAGLLLLGGALGALGVARRRKAA